MLFVSVAFFVLYILIYYNNCLTQIENLGKEFSKVFLITLFFIYIYFILYLL